MAIIKALASSVYPTEGPRWCTRVWIKDRQRPATVEWASRDQAMTQAEIARNGFLSPADVLRVDVLYVDRDDAHIEETVQSHRHLPEDGMWLIRRGDTGVWVHATD